MTAMRVVIVHAHPETQSFSGASVPTISYPKLADYDAQFVLKSR